jgi:hypothetical protein
LGVESPPQLQATKPTNKTHSDEDQQNKDFQSKVIIENPIVKEMEPMQVFQRPTKEWRLPKDWKILLPLLNLQTSQVLLRI